MAEAVRIGRTAILRLSGKLFAAVLSILGVLSCSGNPQATPDYGPPSIGLDVWGRTGSASDSTWIDGIEIKLTTADSLSDFRVDTTGSGGYFLLHMGEEFYPWPDSVRLVATDIDGDQNGSFLSRDTLLSLIGLEDQYDYLQLDVDLYLEDAKE